MILHKGETLFRQGESGPLFHIVTGMLKIIRVHEDGSAFIVNLIVPDEIIPHHSLITPKDYHGTAIALTTTEVEVIPTEAWYRELSTDSNKSMEIALLLQNKLRMMQQRIDQLTKVAPMERLLSLRSWFASYFPEHDLTDLLTQEEIGQLIGLRRETVNRLLHRLNG